MADYEGAEARAAEEAAAAAVDAVPSAPAAGPAAGAAGSVTITPPASGGGTTTVISSSGGGVSAHGRDWLMGSILFFCIVAMVGIALASLGLKEPSQWAMSIVSAVIGHLKEVILLILGGYFALKKNGVEASAA